MVEDALEDRHVSVQVLVGRVEDVFGSHANLKAGVLSDVADAAWEAVTSCACFEEVTYSAVVTYCGEVTYFLEVT